MRILYFSRDYTPHDYRFLAALAQTEHKVYYLRLENRGQAWEDRPVPPEIEIIPWAGGQKPARFRDGLRLLFDLKRVIRDFEPDLIHAGPIQRSAFLAALTGFQPLVSASWGYDLLADAERNRWWEWATRYTLERSAVFVGDCDTIRGLAISYGMDSDRIVTFPWGVDLDHFTPAPRTPHLAPRTSQFAIRQRLGWGDDAFILLSTRGWAPVYGVVDVARAFVRAARQRPELRLLMLGNGPQAGTIHRIFEQAHMTDRVHFPGLISKDKLVDYYRAADLYVSASHSDGSSISLLEALACGTPVLLSDIPGNKEWVEEGDVGWLFREGDAAHLASSLLQAIRARTELPQMGHAARLVAEERANWEENFPKLLDAYQLALG